MRLTFTPGWVSFTPKQITKYPSESNNKPIACLVGEAGSAPRLFKKPHIPGMIAARITTKNGLKDCIHEAGTSQPKTKRSVCSAAKRVSEAPACS